MTSVNVTTTTNTVEVTANGVSTTVTTTPAASVVSATAVGPQGPDAPKSLTLLNPLVGDNFTLFRTVKQTGISAITAVIQGSSSPSLTFAIKAAADRSASGIDVVASVAVTNTTTGTALTVLNQPLAAGTYVWIDVTAKSGTVSELNLAFES